MARSMANWLSTAAAFYQEFPVDKLSHQAFFRDPPRPQIIDSDYFFAPADGIILYQEIVEDPASPYLEVKGENYSLQELTQSPNWDIPCMVVGTFMTFYNVHVNRIPYSGFLKYVYLDPITSRNYPMLMIEKGIINQDMNFQGEDLLYLKKNERVLNEIFSPRLNLTYYVVQIADVDVSAITHFDMDQSEFHTQNERFSMIRWGSQVDLIIPLDDRYEFNFIHKPTDAVQAGLDKMISIQRL
jgi:phosphatidylserine decarboxylase